MDRETEGKPKLSSCLSVRRIEFKFIECANTGTSNSKADY
jgi:hypothetical protein